MKSEVNQNYWSVVRLVNWVGGGGSSGASGEDANEGIFVVGADKESSSRLNI